MWINQQIILQEDMLLVLGSGPWNRFGTWSIHSNVNMALFMGALLNSGTYTSMFNWIIYRKTGMKV